MQPANQKFLLWNIISSSLFGSAGAQERQTTPSGETADNNRVHKPCFFRLSGPLLNRSCWLHVNTLHSQHLLAFIVFGTASERLAKHSETRSRMPPAPNENQGCRALPKALSTNALMTAHQTGSSCRCWQAALAANLAKLNFWRRHHIQKAGTCQEAGTRALPRAGW